MIYGKLAGGQAAGDVATDLELSLQEPRDPLAVGSVSREEDLVFAFHGNIFNGDELGLDSDGDVAKGLAQLYRREGPALFARMNGQFTCSVLDRQRGELVLARDHLGVEPFFYRRDGDGSVAFSTSLRSLARDATFPGALNPEALATYLLLNYNPTDQTLLKEVRKVPPGSVVRIRGGEERVERYWAPDYSKKLAVDEGQIAEALREHLERAVKSRVVPERPAGVALSGGLDSSTVLAFTRRHYPGELYAYSFRCPVESYDESHYSSLAARYYQAEYRQVEYTADRALIASEAVRVMEEPLADLGIEVATFLLGQEASGTIELLLTGDGGDELFAGHPVYLADRVAQKFDRVPGLLKSLLYPLGKWIPESSKKNAFSVKLKRFLEGQKYPPDLYSNRWRLYYTPEALLDLLGHDVRQSLNGLDPLRWLRDLYLQAQSEEYLDRALFGDYYTVVQFYVTRLLLLRHFGIQARCPLLDPALVQFCAEIPAELKIRPSGEQKYIQKKAMESVLPDEIVHRKDKLGHSVPMRKWLTEDADLLGKITGTLMGDSALLGYGILRSEALARMFEEHSSRTVNHAHRIWALYVLELWLRSWS